MLNVELYSKTVETSQGECGFFVKDASILRG